VVIEECLTGEEASALFALVPRQRRGLLIGTAQDHKRLGAGDTGPNTGGMGAYAPAPVVTEAVAEATLDDHRPPGSWPRWSRRGTPYQRGSLRRADDRRGQRRN
jgi:phosphoribosylamine--glycine ligase